MSAVSTEVNTLHFVRRAAIHHQFRRADVPIERRSELEPNQCLAGTQAAPPVCRRHIPPMEIAVPLIDGFLDETIGPVRKK
jgi:hypothetical protein